MSARTYIFAFLSLILVILGVLFLLKVIPYTPHNETLEKIQWPGLPLLIVGVLFLAGFLVAGKFTPKKAGLSRTESIFIPENEEEERGSRTEQLRSRSSSSVSTTSE